LAKYLCQNFREIVQISSNVAWIVRHKSPLARPTTSDAATCCRQRIQSENYPTE
jgi:hypothetical protein